MELNQEQPSPQEHVQSLYKRKTADTENSATLKRSIEVIIDTALKGEQKIFFESLQNADDAEASEITYHLLSDQWLIIKHNGKRQFTYRDVEQICDLANNETSEKSVTGNKIGYKDVGFKSFFSIAAAVLIVSGGYSFRFDKNYKKDEKSSQKFPWPIVPIWTEQSHIPEHIRNQIKFGDNKTYFVLNLKPNVPIEQDLRRLTENPKMLFFLHNLKTLMVNIKSTSYQSIVLKKNKNSVGTYGMYDLFKNQALISSWMIVKFDIDVPEYVRTQLEQTDITKYECPDRIKQAKETGISFAICVKDGKFIPVNEPLFSYLPTRVYPQIPVIVNADFLLVLDRMSLTENPWNSFLLNSILYYLIDYLKDFASDAVVSRFRQQVLTLFPAKSPPPSFPSSLRSAYSKGLNRGINSIEFIPAFASDRLLKANKSTFQDSTGFYAAFPEIAPPCPFIDYQLANISKISWLISTFGFGDLLKYLPNYFETNKSMRFHQRLLLFLMNCSRKNYSVNTSLRDQPILLCADDKTTLVKPKDVFFKSSHTESFPITTKLRFVAEELYANNQQLKNWLVQLGVRNVNPVEIIQRFLLPMINAHKITTENVIAITRFIFLNYQKLSLDDIKQLAYLPVLTKHGDLIPSSCAYLSDAYNPIHKLESVVTDKRRMVSQKYLDGQPHVDAWRSFFAKIGIANKIGFHMTTMPADIVSIVLGSALDRYKPLPVVKGKSYKVPYIDFIELITHPQFSSHIWAAVGDMLNHGYGAQNNPIVSYLQNEDVCPTTSGKTAKSTELFPPEFADLVKGVYLISAIPLTLSKYQFQKLGVITDISLEECITVLTHLIAKKDTRDVIPQYQLVLYEIYKMSMSDRNIKTELLKRRDTLLLPAEDGSLQSTRTLHCFNITNMAIGHLPCWLKKFHESVDLMKFSALLNIPVVNQRNVTVAPTNSKCCAEAKQRLQDRLHILAYANMSDAKDRQKKLEELQGKLKQLDFFTVDKMTLHFEGKLLQPVSFYVERNKLYAKIDFHNPLTNRDYCKFLAKHFNLNKKAKHLLPMVTCFSDDDLTIQLENENYNMAEMERSFSNNSFEVNKTATSSIGLVEQKKTEKKEDPESSFIASFSKLNVTDSSKETPGVQTDNPFQSSIRTPGKSPSANKSPNDRKRSLNSNNTNQSAPFSFDAPDFSFDASPISFRKDSTAEVSNSFSYTPPSSTKKKTSTPKVPRDPERDKETGELGEKHVYNWLRAHYVEKYAENDYKKAIETDQGFILNGYDIKKQREIALTVCWYNKQGESYSQHDIIVQKNDLMKIVEVKATLSSGPADLHISSRQYKEMREYRKRYSLFRVYDVKGQPSIKKVKDPVVLLEERKDDIREIVFNL